MTICVRLWATVYLGKICFSVPGRYTAVWRIARLSGSTTRVYGATGAHGGTSALQKALGTTIVASAAAVRKPFRFAGDYKPYGPMIGPEKNTRNIDYATREADVSASAS